jgi:hypothetical protein
MSRDETTTWRQLIASELQEHPGEELIAVTLDDAALDAEFDGGYGSAHMASPSRRGRKTASISRSFMTVRSGSVQPPAIHAMKRLSISAASSYAVAE